jgi:hypothetical protein
MAQIMMWDHILSVYRGQASNGTVIVVEPPAMELAHKRAGKTVYDSDWWIETVQRTLEHWGIYARRWVDAATHVPRINYSLTRPGNTGTLSTEQLEAPSTPLSSSSLANSGPLLNSGSGPLGSGPLSGNPSPPSSSNNANTISGPLMNRLRSGPLSKNSDKKHD